MAEGDSSDARMYFCPWLDLTEKELQQRREDKFYSGVEFVWDPVAHSDIIKITGDGTIFIREPVAQRSDCCRGKVGFTEGIHVWELGWSTNRGSSACAGVGTSGSRLTTTGYVPLLGLDSESWAWNLGTLELQHNGSTNRYYPADNSLLGSNPPVGRQYCSDYLQLRVILDMNNGTLAYELGGKFLGIAFHGLKGRTLYPMVSAVFGDTSVSLTYLGEFSPGPRELKELCRKVILKSIGHKKAPRAVSKLPLPKAMKKYILLPLT